MADFDGLIRYVLEQASSLAPSEDEIRGILEPLIHTHPGSKDPQNRFGLTKDDLDLFVRLIHAFLQFAARIKDMLLREFHLNIQEDKEEKIYRILKENLAWTDKHIQHLRDEFERRNVPNPPSHGDGGNSPGL
ncbi:MAG: hypothetical protein OXF68_07990 [Gammaproteobacteria bacterium]|nr:hypothetical protein [Gammaproteobacteria bacterium]